MAIPERLESISTNLPFSQLTKFVEALKDESAELVPGSTALIAESAGCSFDFEGATYQADEMLEEVYSVVLVAAKPDFIDTLIRELETELSSAVNKRGYDEAKSINNKIQNLAGLKTNESLV